MARGATRLPREKSVSSVQRAEFKEKDWFRFTTLSLFNFVLFMGRPELEFNPKNLIPLCEGPQTNDHHVAIGHLGDFQHLNQDVLTDITGPWKALARAAIEILPDFLARRRWPVKPLGADDQAALIALMNQLYGPKPQESVNVLIQQWYGFKPSRGGTLSSDMSNDAPLSNPGGN